tara:strand:+ start:12096 stop:13097 length:1002 start_codon:yes stop_codon:yes gene_type:complete
MTTGNVLLSVDEYVRINVGLNPILLQVHRDAVRIVFSELKPVRSNESFHILSGDQSSTQIPSIDTNVWVLATSDKSSLTITETDSRAVARTFTSDMILDISKGLIPGHSMVYVNSYANIIDATTKLVWPFASQYVFSDVPTSFWLASTNAADTQNILIQTLDADYNPQSFVIALTGQTPVEFAIGVGLRINKIRCVSPNKTLGDVYASRENNHTGGLPNNLSLIVSAFEQDHQTSGLALYTVRAGHTLFGYTGYFSAPKGRDDDFFWNARNPELSIPDTITNVVSIYEGPFEVNFAMTPIPEKTDAYFSSKTTQASGRVSLRVVGILVDNNYL